MSEDNKPAEGAIPPRFTLKKADSSASGPSPVTAAEAAKKQTARVDLPPPAAEQAPVLKKKTARIPLDQVSADAGAPSGAPVAGVGISSKTIRLAPPTPPPPTISIPPATPVTRVMTRAGDDAKRQTSRISLETALAEHSDGGASAPGTPKTIRIKRPGAAPVAAPSTAATVPASPGEAAGGAKSSTARIDLPEAIPAEGQPTQRKTIKIRRADGGGATIKPVPRSVAVARLEAQAAERRAEETTQATHVLFPIAAAVAVLVLAFMIYALLVQAFPGANLSFPGKITL
jgi:hypothetical protein